MPPKYKSKFSNQWLDVSDHPTWTWLQKVAGDNSKGRCTLCRVEFDVSNMGATALLSHEKGKKHSERYRAASGYEQHTLKYVKSAPITVIEPLLPGTSETAVGPPDVEAPNATPTMANVDTVVTSERDEEVLVTNISKPLTSKGRTGLESYMTKAAVARAEIIWALNGVMSHGSLRGSAKGAELFPLMFPDSDIASRFRMQKDKSAYVVTYGLGPFFQEQLSVVLQKCQFFSVSFDESLNTVAQKGQMDLVVRFWDSAADEVSTRYMTSAFLEHATAEDLLRAFTSKLASHQLDMKKMLHVSMDGPNVNLKFIKDLRTFLHEDSDSSYPEIFDLGTCSLHVVHGSYKTAHNACGWKVNVFLHALYYLFKDFPSRRASYYSSTKSSVFPLRFCAIRWVENSNIIQRALDMIPLFKTYLAATSKKPPSSNSYTKVADAVKDEMLSAKLGFLQSVALQLEPYLTAYQTNDPVLPFMYQDLYKLLRSLMLRFVKTDIMNGVTDVVKLMAVDLEKKENDKVIHNIDIGFAASAACTAAKGVQVLQFKEECLLYLKHMTVKLVAKCPLEYKIVKGATCFNPEIMLSETLKLSRVTTALEVFIESKRTSPGTADRIKRAYVQVCEMPSVRRILKEFKRGDGRLDHFLMRIFKEVNADVDLQTFMPQILVLFHGNAAVERSFSNKECLVENLHEDSLIAQRVVYDSVSATGGIAAVQITKSMIQAMRNASAMRVESLKRKADDETEKANKLKRVATEIKLLEAKKARLALQAKKESEAIASELKQLQKMLKY